jgi:hypothetical protein
VGNYTSATGTVDHFECLYRVQLRSRNPSDTFFTDEPIKRLGNRFYVTSLDHGSRNVGSTYRAACHFDYALPRNRSLYLFEPVDHRTCDIDPFRSELL